MGVAEEIIRAVEARISKNDYETAVAFDIDGNVVFEKEGDSKEVGYTLEELSKLNGCIVTHNHAYDKDWKYFGIKNTSAFSSDDLLFAYQHELYETRMVIGNETHIFRWNNPDKKKAEIFIYKMILLEDETNKNIETIATDAREAVKKSIADPTQENEDSMDKVVYKFYKEQQKQADIINNYIANNQHVGFVFRKECV